MAMAAQHGVWRRLPLARWLLLLLIGPAMLASLPVWAEPATTATPPPLFNSHAPLSVELTADWGALVRDRRAAPSYVDGSLSVASSQSTPKILHLKIRPRGKSRRIKTNCAFPPLRLNFKTKEVANTVFEGQDKMKLVTHCGKLGSNRQAHRDQLHSEYLLYRIFNLITPYSFQVRRLNITYSHPDGLNSARRKSHIHPAFVIEHKSALAARTGMSLASQPSFSLESLDAYQAELGAMFAYFSGNTDYSFTRGPQTDACCHNAIALGGSSRVIPVPYDFDSTGFVDPPYAAPAAKLKISNVTRRLYRGFCTHQKELEAVRTNFLAKQASIVELIQEYPDISAKRRRKLSRYAADFFTTLKSAESFNKRISSRCR